MPMGGLDAGLQFLSMYYGLLREWDLLLARIVKLVRYFCCPKYLCVFRPKAASIPAGIRPPFRWESGHRSALTPATVPEQSGQF